MENDQSFGSQVVAVLGNGGNEQQQQQQQSQGQQVQASQQGQADNIPVSHLFINLDF